MTYSRQEAEREARLIFGRWVLALFCLTWLCIFGAIWAPFGATWKWAVSGILVWAVLMYSIVIKERIITNAVDKVVADR